LVKSKKRYLLFGVITALPQLNRETVQETVWEALKMLIGNLGSSHSELSLIFYHEKKQLGILRSSNRNLTAVRAALTLISEINGRRTSFLTLRTSGTIITLKKLIHASKSNIITDFSNSPFN
jgi:ribonuclease P/MRP protein subunit POP5